MIMGQAAGAAASIAIDQGSSVQSVPYSSLSAQLSQDGVVLSIPLLSATSLTYKPQSVGTAGNSQSVYLTNVSSTPLSITSIAMSGQNASSFVFANSCGPTLAAGASCTIHGHLAPVTAGALTAIITITDNANGSSQTIALYGTGVAAAGAALSSSSLSYGNVEVGTSSGSQQVILTNGGDLTLSISSISLTGTNSSQFVFANTCGSSLAVGANCTIHGHFAPIVAGAMTAAVTITDNAPTSPQTITLGGAGLSPPSASLSNNQPELRQPGYWGRFSFSRRR